MIADVLVHASAACPIAAPAVPFAAVEAPADAASDPSTMLFPPSRRDPRRFVDARGSAHYLLCPPGLRGGHSR